MLTKMPTTPLAIGQYAPDFELQGVDEKVYHLSRYLEEYQAIAVVFLSNSCPNARGSIDSLKALQLSYNSQGLALIAINANEGESFREMQEFSQQNDLNFPYLRDTTQDVARCFGVEKTPQCFLVDHDWTLRYKGGIEALIPAIQSLLNNEKILVTESDFIGCSIKWRSN